MSTFKNITNKTLVLPRDDGKGASIELSPNETFEASNFYKKFLLDAATGDAQLQLLADDGNDTWPSPGGYLGAGLKNPLLTPNFVTLYEYVQVADVDASCYVVGSAGCTKKMKVFLNGAELGDMAKTTCYFYGDASYPTCVTRIVSMESVVNVSDLDFVCGFCE